MAEPSELLEMSTHALLGYARDRGYDNGFTAPENANLLALERLGLIERNPCSDSDKPHWRITEKGEAGP